MLRWGKMKVDLSTFIFIFGWIGLCAAYNFLDDSCYTNCTKKASLPCTVQLGDFPCGSSDPLDAPALWPGMPESSSVDLVGFEFDPTSRGCLARYRVSWELPNDASLLQVKGFQLELLGMDSHTIGIQNCMSMDLSGARWTQNDILHRLTYSSDCILLRPRGVYSMLLYSLPKPPPRMKDKFWTKEISVPDVVQYSGKCRLRPTTTSPATTKATTTPRPPKVPATGSTATPPTHKQTTTPNPTTPSGWPVDNQRSWLWQGLAIGLGLLIGIGLVVFIALWYRGRRRGCRGREEPLDDHDRTRLVPYVTPHQPTQPTGRLTSQEDSGFGSNPTPPEPTTTTHLYSEQETPISIMLRWTTTRGLADYVLGYELYYQESPIQPRMYKHISFRPSETGYLVVDLVPETTYQIVLVTKLIGAMEDATSTIDVLTSPFHAPGSIASIHTEDIPFRMQNCASSVDGYGPRSYVSSVNDTIGSGMA